MKDYIKYLKWVLMLIGASRFKLYGAFVGFFIGMFIEEWLAGNIHLLDGKYKESNDVVFSTFQLKLNLLVIEVLRISNTITRQQSLYILKYYYKNFGTQKGKALYNKLKKDIKVPSNGFASAAYLNTVIDYSKKIDVIRFLHGLISVDQRISIEEKRVLGTIAKALGISKNDFDQLFRQHQKTTSSRRHKSYVHKYYEILDVNERVSNDDLKKAYRKKVLKYHPDRTRLNPKEAAEKFQKVQDAYDYIREIRGVK